MSTALKASLESAIQKWADEQLETSIWLTAYWPDSQTARMADAAYSVLMASVEGQQYAESENNQ